MLRYCDCSDRLKENDDFRDPFCTSFVKQRLALKYGESNKIAVLLMLSTSLEYLEMSRAEIYSEFCSS